MRTIPKQENIELSVLALYQYDGQTLDGDNHVYLFHGVTATGKTKEEAIENLACKLNNGHR